MKVNPIESTPVLPHVHSGRLDSPASSKMKLSGIEKTRKIAKNLTSPLLQQRQGIHIHDDNEVDITPKLLTHPTFSSIDERQITAFETIELSQMGNVSQLLPCVSTISGTLAGSSSLLIRTSSVPSGSVSGTGEVMQSLLSTHSNDYCIIFEDEAIAPPAFYLPSTDPNVFYTRPKTVTVTLKETETFFIFEMQPRTGDLQTEEGQAIKIENEQYDYKTIGTGFNRKLVNAETQTMQVLLKSRGTYLGKITRKNRGVYVNKWVVHDTLAASNFMTERNGVLVVHTKGSMQEILQSEQVYSRLPKSKRRKRTFDEDYALIMNNPNFAMAVRVVERIISHNIFIHVQKRFTRLIKQDPCSLDLEFTYSLDLLWTHTYERVNGRAAVSLRWNPANMSILAVGYGPDINSTKKDGVVCVWTAKNPSAPGRLYTFESGVSDINWSRERYNLLATGFYNGQIIVIDVSSNNLNIVRKSNKATSPSCSPQWQVQWWKGDEQFDYEEQIYTCDQDGHVFCYRYAENFQSTTMMKIYRIEGTLAGVTRTTHCNLYDISINRSPGALVLSKHPALTTIYFIGSNEGCVYKCSTNYLYQHIESFLAHDGPVYNMAFSPFCSKIFLTCGADWCTRIWAEGITEPLITLQTTMAVVRYAMWSPLHSTIIATITNNEISIWDIRRKTYTCMSVIVSPNKSRFVKLQFSWDGHRLAAADVDGIIYVYNLVGMPFPPYNHEKVLVESIEKALVTKPHLLQKLKKLGPPFSDE